MIMTLRARDVMQPEVTTVDAVESRTRLDELLAQGNVSGMPVVDCGIARGIAGCQ
jgi:CBS domain-containing protein